MYIVDSDNYRIRKVNSTGIITTIAGTGANGYNGEGGAATAAWFSNLRGIAIDTVGNLYVTDGSSEIRIINTSGIVNAFAGGNGLGSGGDGGPATAAQLHSPQSLTFDKAGNLYIADAGNYKIRVINTAGIINTIAGNGTFGFSGDGGQATMASLSNIYAVAIDTVGNLYLADANNNRIRKIDTSGIIQTIAGIGTAGFSGDGGLATQAKLNNPSGVATDIVGNIFIADGANNRIRMIYNCNSITYYPTLNYSLTASSTPHIWSVYPAYSSNVTNAQWYWGDGTSTIGLYPSHTYSVSGKYNICVTVFSSCGDSAQFCQNDSLYRYSNNSTSSNMIYLNVLNGNQTTNINHLSNNSDYINIYPNPTSNIFTIETSNTDKQTLQIFDVNGKLILSQTITGKTNIDASNLAQGVYNLSLTNAIGFVNKRLVIVR